MDRFSANFERGEFSDDICTEFREYRANLTQYTYHKVTFWGSNNPIGYTCTDPEIADTICQSLAVGLPMPETFCDGHNWQVGFCGDYNNEIGMEILVDARSVCGCDSAGASMRPCIGVWNWGGFDGPKCLGNDQSISMECSQCKIIFRTNYIILSFLAKRTSRELCKFLVSRAIFWQWYRKLSSTDG